SSGLIIPGYNGIKINVIKSLLKLEKLGKWDETQIVYEEIKPYLTISDFKPEPIHFGNPNKPMVSLIFKVAWGNEYLIDLLRILYQSKVKATFFLNGSWTYKFPQLAKKIKDYGHEIGSHSYSHPDMRGMTIENIKWELKETNRIIQKELGLLPKLFTPPSEEYDERVVYCAAQEGMYTILSTIDTEDWKNPNPKDIEEKIRIKLRNGAFILCHPTETSLIALPSIIKVMRGNGYKIRTVSKLISTKRL
ncbi:MAG TPA: polysaccharide deacetylase family protein, partial [Clostridia bacterium]